MLEKIEDSTIIRDQIDILAQCYRDLLDSKGITASGNLKNFTTDIQVEDGHFRVYFNLADYWKYIENGRGPGRFPPIDAIMDWIRIKPIVPRSINGRIPSSKQLAYMIGRKIATVGYEGRHPLKEAIYLPQSASAIQLIRNEIISQIREDLIAKIKD